MELRLRHASRCGLERQYDLVEAGVTVGQVIATIIPRWSVMVVGLRDDGTSLTRAAQATSRYDAARVRRRLLAQLKGDTDAWQGDRLAAV